MLAHQLFVQRAVGLAKEHVALLEGREWGRAGYRFFTAIRHRTRRARSYETAITVKPRFTAHSALTEGREKRIVKSLPQGCPKILGVRCAETPMV